MTVENLRMFLGDEKIIVNGEAFDLSNKCPKSINYFIRSPRFRVAVERWTLNKQTNWSCINQRLQFLKLSITTKVHVTPNDMNRTKTAKAKENSPLSSLLLGWTLRLKSQPRRKRRERRREKELKISSISDLMVFDRKRNGMNFKQNDINNRQ